LPRHLLKAAGFVVAYLRKVSRHLHDPRSSARGGELRPPASRASLRLRSASRRAFALEHEVPRRPPVDPTELNLLNVVERFDALDDLRHQYLLTFPQRAVEPATYR